MLTGDSHGRKNIEAKRRTFSDEFKQNAVARIVNQGYSFNAAADAVGVAVLALRRWRYCRSIRKRQHTHYFKRSSFKPTPHPRGRPIALSLPGVCCIQDQVGQYEHLNILSKYWGLTRWLHRSN
ncbi:transposase [Novipirellula artificiosorum]|uniref:transposase n=1 Tax=Novipirellula artificiosorum TaxID=2528016 RepID=UPI0011B4EEB7